MSCRSAEITDHIPNHVAAFEIEPPANTAGTIAAYVEAGLTWWLERVGSPWVGSLRQTRSQIRRGPP